MKNKLITVILLLIFSKGISQNPKYEYSGRFMPSIQKEKLFDADYINDIMPEFCIYLYLAYGDHDTFMEQYKVLNAAQYKSLDALENYYKIIEFDFIEISGTCNGTTLTAQSSGKRLTMEQKNIINNVDIGTDINVNFKFKYINQAKNNVRNPTNEIEGQYSVTVVPFSEAEYPGGYTQFSEYINENVFSKISNEKLSNGILHSMVKFTINEDGELVDAKISRSSDNEYTDSLLLNAFKKMPRWKPAKNANGIKVKQPFSLALGNGGC
jgi:TonB family protein